MDSSMVELEENSFAKVLALVVASLASVPSEVTRGGNLDVQKFWDTDLASDQNERPPAGQDVSLVAIREIKEFLVLSIKAEQLFRAVT